MIIILRYERNTGGGSRRLMPRGWWDALPAPPMSCCDKCCACTGVAAQHDSSGKHACAFVWGMDMPPMPAFYANPPQTVDDNIQHIARSAPVWSGAYAQRASLARTATVSVKFTGEWIMAFDDLRSFLHALISRTTAEKSARSECGADPPPLPTQRDASMARPRCGLITNIRGFTGRPRR